MTGSSTGNLHHTQFMLQLNLSGQSWPAFLPALIGQITDNLQSLLGDVAVMKTCSKCKIEKPLDQFTNNKSCADGKCVYCKPCAHAKSLAYNTAHREQTRAASALQRKVNAASGKPPVESKRCPKWLSAEQFAQIESFYLQTKLIFEMTDEVWRVDHIIPLQGKKVSGLHVPWNLQILPALVNINKHEP